MTRKQINTPVKIAELIIGFCWTELEENGYESEVDEAVKRRNIRIRASQTSMLVRTSCIKTPSQSRKIEGVSENSKIIGRHVS